MLTMYLDESLEQNDGYAVVAGFIGNDESWNLCMRLWGESLARHNRPSLHMKDLRWKRNRHTAMLADLGGIPSQCGLTLVYASVKVSDYLDLIQGTLGEVIASGYHLAMLMVLGYSMAVLPPEDRVEVICEQQDEFSGVRESFLKLAFEMEEWKTPGGLPRVAKWSAIPKSRILEPSDFAAYALLQALRDVKSKKTEMCAPILLNPRTMGHCIGREEARIGVSGFIAQTKDGAIAQISSKARAYVRRRFNAEYGGNI
ncbi:hypothetical protein AciX9_0633 [Granulicella tundricola MP5ACTX9]|uniref:DUF3800 domain-containing protein n=2 Tax=Granulicella TaxID=940557 RepID=E8WZA2_GRATM|nr:hypothetical protein AciX9_0633 [Granulicella tundricola MP5ACTX9]